MPGQNDSSNPSAPSPEPDFIVEPYGSVFFVRCRHEAAQKAMAEFGERDAQWFGGALAAEPRFIGGLVSSLREDGLEGPVTAKILPFAPRAEQIRRRGMENYARWKRIIKGMEPYGPKERHRIFRQHAENERKDRESAIRHRALPGGARILVFSQDIARRPVSPFRPDLSVGYFAAAWRCGKGQQSEF